MTMIVAGRIVPMSDDHEQDRETGREPVTSFAGRVWIDESGTIAAVTRDGQPDPPGFVDSPIVDVGESLVVPGLIDMHSHLAYQALPLWTQPGRTTPFAHHNSWPDAPSYPASVTWPAYAFITAAPEELLAYAETKAIVGGTTSIQGSPPKNRPRDGWLVRNIEDETWGTANGNLVYASTLTLPSETLAQRAKDMARGSVFIYHCGEGQRGSIVAREFVEARQAGCLGPNFAAVHTNSVAASEYAQWTDPGCLVWSPLSNLWLYGETADVPAAIRAGIKVCLGSDWSPSGSRNVLGELKVARIVADHNDWELSDEDLVRMVTTNPGDLLAAAWTRQTGRLTPGAVADLTVVAAAPRANAFRQIVRATERDVRLVVIGGSARYGTPTLMRAAHGGRVATWSTISVAGTRRVLDLRHPDDPQRSWPLAEVTARLEQVRANPKREIEKAVTDLADAGDLTNAGDLTDAAGPAGRRAPLRLALDMPTGLPDVALPPVAGMPVGATLPVGATPAGGLPVDLADITIPPLDGFTHNRSFARRIQRGGFHGGILDRLADFYPPAR